MKSKYPLTILSVAYTAVILYFSSLPAGVGGPGGLNPGGELVHFAAYAVYAALLFVTLSKTTSTGKSLAFSLLLAAILGAVTEAVQLYVPGRFCDLADFTTNVIGTLAGLAVMFLLSRRLRSLR